MKLDVGCGDHPTGDVNCDLNMGSTLHGGDQKKDGIFINAKEIPNFVKCDAQHLPFKDHVFSEVFCCHVIEHVDNPLLLLSELLRVGNDVTVKCPYHLSRGARMPSHTCSFSISWFRKALKTLKVTEGVVLEYNGFTYFPHVFMPLIRIPLEIKMVVHCESYL